MKSKFAAFVVLFSAVFVLASCLNTDDNYTYTDDSAITAFSVTKGKQYLHVKSSKGTDSIVTNDVTLSSYDFYIDQVNRVIYNPDSLPCGVDAKKLIVSVSSRNSGVVFIKSATSDSLSYLSTSDSTDFSVDRELQVVSNSGAALRKYTVKVNVHKEFPDSFAWHAMPVCDELRSLTGMRVVAAGDNMLLFGSNGTSTQVFAFRNGAWTACSPDFNHSLSADSWRSVVVKDGKAFLCTDGAIMSTADGSSWTEHAKSTGITRLVAASRFRIYGYATDGHLMSSSDNGASWTDASIDDEASLLPNAETAYVSLEESSNKLTDRVLLFGTRDAAQYPSDTNLLIWGKIDEGADNSQNQAWAYYYISETNKHAAPLLTNISAMPYDDGVYLLGNEKGSTPAFYKTRDKGVTWNTDTTLLMPSTFNDNIVVNPAAASYCYSVAVDKNNVLWLVNARNGKTWCGRINRLGWKKEQTDFTE